MTDQPEQKWRKTLVKDLRKIHAIPVENPVRPGTPDVNFCEGWLELKVLDAWPALDDTVVKFEKLTPQQKVFAKMRWRAGGNMWIFVKVKTDFLLFRGCDADLLGTLTKQGLIGVTVRYWQKRVNVSELISIITARQ